MIRSLTNSTCRNTFSKHKEKATKTPPHPNEKQIFAIIRRNYDILKRLSPKCIHPGHQFSRFLRDVPPQFNKNFLTGMTETKEGIWYVCFDRGWRETDHSITMKGFPEKSNL